MLKQLLPAFRLFLALTVLTGVVYPFIVTIIAQAVFPAQANGSLVMHNNTVFGSALIGQKFDAPRYFSARPSAMNNNPLPSGGSNLGPTSQVLKDQIAQRAAAFRAANGLPQDMALPADVLTASASGLDPHLSPAAAQLQIARVAQTRGLPVEQVRALVAQYTEAPQFGFLGESRVNVLLLNLALDGIK